MIICAAAQAAGLALAGWHFRHALNPDGVAYLRIGSYWANGQWGLAVSGYWGPMLSWLVALLLKTGLALPAAGRIAMALSAMVFFWGCVAVFRVFELDDHWVRRGAWAAAAAGIYWSVEFITPDLLVAGLVGIAASQALRQDWLARDRVRLRAGAIFGAAYLAKAAAFPLAILFIVLTGIGALRRGRVDAATARRSTGLTLLAFGLVASPWVVGLTLKYGTPTISTTARITHALAGPPDMDRYHPAARRFHVPEAGRVTSWEDPSNMAYRTWSPFENWSYAVYQAEFCLRNLAFFMGLLTTLNVLWPLLALDWLAGLAKGRRKWAEPLLMAALLAAIYLPFLVKITEQRYFYAAFPFLFAAAAMRTTELAAARPQQSAVILRVGGWAVMVAVLAPLLLAVYLVRDSIRIAGERAFDLAGRIQAAQLAGPIAGSGNLPGGRAGLYLAFYLNQPWYGDELQPTPGDVTRSSAKLFVANRESRIATALLREPGATDLDAKLFSNLEEAKGFPLQVFELRSP